MNVAQKLVECLAAEGVEYIFGIPGEENLEVIEAILRQSSLAIMGYDAPEGILRLSSRTYHSPFLA